MDAQQFTYWLQGFAELHADPPTAEQWQSIREHLETVFVKVTPPVRLGPLQGFPQRGLPRQDWQRPATTGDPLSPAYWLGSSAQSYC